MDKERFRSYPHFCVLGRVEQFGSRGEKGRAGVGKSGIKDEGRVTFFILGDLDGGNSGFGDAAFSTLDLGEKGRERKRKGKKETEGEQGMAWTWGKEEHVQYSFSFLNNQLGKFRVENNSHRYRHRYTPELIWSQQSHKCIEI